MNESTYCYLKLFSLLLFLHPNIISTVRCMLVSTETHSFLSFHLFLIMLVTPSYVSAPTTNLRDQSVTVKQYLWVPSHYHHWHLKSRETFFWHSVKSCNQHQWTPCTAHFSVTSQKTKPEPHGRIFVRNDPVKGLKWYSKKHPHLHLQHSLSSALWVKLKPACRCHVGIMNCSIYWHRI